MYLVPPRPGDFDATVSPDKQINQWTNLCSESFENGCHPFRSDWMQFNGMVGYRDIFEAAIVQIIHECDEETACAEACFTYSEFLFPRPCGRKGIHNAGALKKDVLRFFDGIDHIEIAVVIMFVYKKARR